MTEARKFRAIKGVRDILPPGTFLWNWFEATARDVLESYNFREIRLPIFEETQLFARSVGADTDIVSKEMYTFFDPFRDLEYLEKLLSTRFQHLPLKDPEQRIKVIRAEMERTAPGEMLTLRPEVTASVVRAYIEHGMHTLPGDVKLYCMGPMFRRERPQKGRFRQFYQIDAEVLGQSDAPAIDAEVIEMLMTFFDKCGLQGTTLYLNSIGHNGPDCRRVYVGKLYNELVKIKGKLGADSQRRIATNPLRVLDSKLESEQPYIEKLPRIVDYLCPACAEHYAALKRELKLRGIAYKENWRLVRGLDYYTRTTFEVTAPGLGAQDAICGGGRYDGLVELLGGPKGVKGIGFAIGTDRAILSIEQSGKAPAPRALDVFIAWMGAPAYARAVPLARKLRDAGVIVELPAEGMKFKKSLGLASKLGARYALILGEDELASGRFTLKRLADGEQKKFAEAELLEHLKMSNFRSQI